MTCELLTWFLCSFILSIALVHPVKRVSKVALPEPPGDLPSSKPGDTQHQEVTNVIRSPQKIGPSSEWFQPISS